MRVPWTARRSNQSILKEINPECSLEGLLLKLKPQYFDHLMQRADSLEKTLMLGKIEGKRRRRQQRIRWLASLAQRTWIWAQSRRQWRTEEPGLLQSMGSQKVRHDVVIEQQQQRNGDYNSECVCVSHSVMSDTSWPMDCQAPLSVEFSRKEYWSGLPCPSPGDLPDRGIEPGSPKLQADSLPFELPRRLFFFPLVIL